MKFSSIAAILCATAIAAPASAQNVSNDVRCFVLSNAFSRAAKEETGRKIASASLSFYLGRLDGKASPAVIANALAQQRVTIDAKLAPAQMGECAKKMVRAEQAIQVLMKQSAPK